MTSFYLATTPQEYKACHAILKQLGLPDGPLTFPTVYAKRDDKIIGVAGRGPSNGTIVLHRLAALPANPGLLLIKLVEAFENVLKGAGATTYLIAADKRNQKLNDYIKRIIKEEPYAESEHDLWYKRSMI